MKILVVNGPNINFLGIRERGVYGTETYDELLDMLKVMRIEYDVVIEEYQSNHEGDLVDKIQSAYGDFDGIVINPAAYTHTSIAILDALKAVSIKAVEVHISKVEDREDFRQISYAGQACVKKITGKGILGYKEAIEFLLADREN
ncbi:MAG: type II 3-dehydroquinate dehydratase [Bacillota bacterium]